MLSSIYDLGVQVFGVVRGNTQYFVFFVYASVKWLWINSFGRLCSISSYYASVSEVLLLLICLKVTSFDDKYKLLPLTCVLKMFSEWKIVVYSVLFIMFVFKFFVSCLKVYVEIFAGSFIFSQDWVSCESKGIFWVVLAVVKLNYYKHICT